MTGLRQSVAAELRDYWRFDAMAFVVVLLLGIVIRSTMLQSPAGAALVSILLEPAALVIAIVTRPLFVPLNAGFRLQLPALLLTALIFVGAALLETAWAKIVTTTIGWTVPTWSPLQSWLAPWSYYCFVFTSWGIARLWTAAEIAARREAERAAGARAEALRAELQNLRHQLDPHFLFNALGGIASEITLRPQEAVEMVRDLADYLRYSLDHHDVTVAPFADEIEAMRAYLDLQKARFGGSLQFQLCADIEARRQRTPAYLLQSLVENAVKHGLKSGRTPLNVTVQATCDDAGLHIVVANTGTLDAVWMNHGDPGVGLSILRRRLALHYPERHSFDIRQAGDMVRAQLELRGEPCSA